MTTYRGPVWKTGKSLVITIPKNADIEVKEGDNLRITIEKLPKQPVDNLYTLRLGNSPKDSFDFSALATNGLLTPNSNHTVVGTIGGYSYD